MLFELVNWLYNNIDIYAIFTWKSSVYITLYMFQCRHFILNAFFCLKAYIKPFSANFLQAWLVGRHIHPLVEHRILLRFHVRRSWTFSWHFEAADSGLTSLFSHYLRFKLFWNHLPKYTAILTVPDGLTVLYGSSPSTSLRFLEIPSSNLVLCQHQSGLLPARQDIPWPFLLCIANLSSEKLVLFLWLDLGMLCTESSEEPDTCSWVSSWQARLNPLFITRIKILDQVAVYSSGILAVLQIQITDRLPALAVILLEIGHCPFHLQLLLIAFLLQ